MCINILISYIYKSDMKKSLQERYDKMVAHSKKTGGCYLHEPLRYELNDTFSAMENIAPDSVFSMKHGLHIDPNTLRDEIDEGASGDNLKDDKKNKKTAKCKYPL